MSNAKSLAVLAVIISMKLRAPLPVVPPPAELLLKASAQTFIKFDTWAFNFISNASLHEAL
jgi:hypothetical protein